MLNKWTNKLTLSASLIGAFSTITIVQPQVAFSLTPEQVNEKAKAFTVKIDGAEKGSGVIIAKSGNKYTVLTNWHVVDSEGNYTIQTRDGTTHQGENIQQIQRADLAVIYFNSNKSYEVAIKGNSDELSEGQTIHYAGYPTTQGRVYRFFGSKSITGFLSDANIENMSEGERIQSQQGYDIIFEGTGLYGISGSPILDNNSNLIGIAGSGTPAIFGGASLYGIPIKTAEELAKIAGINISWLTPIKAPSSATTNPSQSSPLSPFSPTSIRTSPPHNTQSHLPESNPTYPPRNTPTIDDFPNGNFRDDTWSVSLCCGDNIYSYRGQNLRTGDSLNLSNPTISGSSQRRIYTWRNGRYRYQVVWQNNDPLFIRLQVFSPNGREILNRLLEKQGF
ncbi:hypothetical protein CWATWH0005_5271 [Crocosphaera watsonii WH 0005]|nr:hypothetical protein CWATWH0005_5271 [Crocosphaera watsonii WH 0005]